MSNSLTQEFTVDKLLQELNEEKDKYYKFRHLLNKKVLKLWKDSVRGEEITTQQLNELFPFYLELELQTEN
jgi:Ser/Thr protein kinase RdoA (MazF antagonist)